MKRGATSLRQVFLIMIAAIIALAGSLPLLHSAFAAPGDYSYGHQIGAAAMGQYPRLVAAAPDGTVYVEDNHRNELVHFSADGTVLNRIANWGYSYALDVAPDGVIYRATYNTVERRASDGTLLSSFTIGSLGSGGMAVDANGNVYLAADNAVLVYDATGTQVGSLGTGTAGPADGQFNQAMRVAVHDGEVYVTDLYNHRVQVFTPSGTFLRKFATESYPRAIDVAPTGEVFVGAESSNLEGDVVTTYSSTGAILGSFGPKGYDREDGTIYSYLQDLTVGSTGEVYIIDAVPRLQQFAANTYTFQRELTTADDPEHGLYSPAHIARDKDGNIYVFDYDAWNNPDVADTQHRVIRKYSAAGALIDTITIRVEYRFDDGPGNYHHWYVSPNGMQIDADGNIYFVGHHNEWTQDSHTPYAIAKYAPDGGDPEFSVNHSVSSGYDLNVYSFQLDPSTGDFWLSGYIYDYTDGAEYRLARVSPGGGDPEFFLDNRDLPDGSYIHTQSVALGPDGRIYVGGFYHDTTDPSNPQTYSVFRVDRDGGNLTGLILQDQASDDGSYGYVNAYSVGTDRHGNLYVGGSLGAYNSATDTYTQYIVAKYTADGEFISYIAQYGTEGEEDLSGISGNSGMLVDPNGNVYALDPGKRVVKVYLIEPNVPTAPRNLEANPDATSIQITWQPPVADDDAPVEHYVVRVREAGGTWVEVAVLGSDARSYTLTSLNGQPLKKGVTYEFGVLARNRSGDSPIANVSTQLATGGTTNSGDGEEEAPTAPDSGVAAGVSGAFVIVMAGAIVVGGLGVAVRRQR